jgi:general secretion pathway protein D
MNSRIGNWNVPSALTLASLALCALPSGASKKDKSASALYKAGVTAEAKEDWVTAFDDYYRAYQKSPKDLEYKTSYERLKVQAAAVSVHKGEKLRDQGDLTGAITEFMRALQIDPGYELAEQDIKAVREKMEQPPANGESSLGEPGKDVDIVASPVELRPTSNETIDIHATEDAKVAYETAGKIAGINVLFDPDWQSKRITVDLKNVSVLDALRIIGLNSNTFWRPVTSNTIFVAQNTRAKRTELDEQAVETFYLSNAAAQNDLNDVQTAVRNLIGGTAKLYAVPSQNAIVMRATPDELLLAKQVIQDLDKARPEVVVDVAVLEVSKQVERNIGVSLPQSFGLTLQANTNTTSATTSTSTSTTDTSTSSTTNGLTLNQLGSLNATNFGVTVGQATANLLYTNSDTKVLQNPRVRATDGQKAEVKVGEKIPVATGSYQTGAATAVVSSLVNTQFQYLEVGVDFEITPTVHLNHDVTLKLKLVISQESSSVTISGVTEPIISQRTVDQTIRLRDGEPEILSGILTQQTSNSITGTPGLGELPLLKYLFSSTDRTVSKDEIVFVLTPHVVRGEQLTPQNLQEVDSGTGQNIEVRRIATIPVRIPVAALEGKATATASMTTPAPIPPAQAAPQITPVQPPTPPTADTPANAANLNVGPIRLAVISPATPLKVGATFQVPVNLTGGKDVDSVPLQVTYDTSKLTFINADTGDFLGRDGQIVSMAHREDNGNVVLSLSRPPNVAGVSGDGSLCVLTFVAKSAGDSIVSLSKATARNSQQQALPVTTAGAILHVTQ